MPPYGSYGCRRTLFFYFSLDKKQTVYIEFQDLVSRVWPIFSKKISRSDTPNFDNCGVSVWLTLGARPPSHIFRASAQQLVYGASSVMTSVTGGAWCWCVSGMTKGERKIDWKARVLGITDGDLQKVLVLLLLMFSWCWCTVHDVVGVRITAADGSLGQSVVSVKLYTADAEWRFPTITCTRSFTHSLHYLVTFSAIPAALILLLHSLVFFPDSWLGSCFRLSGRRNRLETRTCKFSTDEELGILLLPQNSPKRRIFSPNVGILEDHFLHVNFYGSSIACPVTTCVLMIGRSCRPAVSR